jgi:hypothetical protein
MLNSWFIHTINIKRESVSSQNSFGENVSTTSTIYANQIARVEEESTLSPRLEHKDSGLRKNPDAIIYVPSTITVLENDIIEYPIGTAYGRVDHVYKALRGQSVGADHYELFIEFP